MRRRNLLMIVGGMVGFAGCGDTSSGGSDESGSDGGSGNESNASGSGSENGSENTTESGSESGQDEPASDEELEEQAEEQAEEEQQESSGGSSSSSGAVVVEIDYDGEWAGAVGSDGSTRSVDGSGSETLEVDSGATIVSANAQKQDDSSDELTVRIVVDDEVVAEQSTTAEYGVAQVSTAV